MESLINIANLLYILTYFVQDLLRIRFLTLVGSAMLVVYFSLQPEPVMALIYWNVFFILLNIFQLARLVAQPKTGTDLFNRSKRLYGVRPYNRHHVWLRFRDGKANSSRFNARKRHHIKCV